MTRESDIEKYLVAKAKSLGGKVGRRGAPDRLVMLPPTGAIWIELKAPGEKPKAYQVREHERMRAMGQRVEIVDSFERVDEVLS